MSSTAEELAAAYVAWRDWQKRQNARPRPGPNDRHNGGRDVQEALDEQYERNLVEGRLMLADKAYRAETSC